MLMLGQTQQARSKHVQNVATYKIILDFKSNTTYRHRQEKQKKC